MCTERSELVFHACKIIIKPPGGSVLDLSGYAAVVITSAERIDDSIIGRVKRIDDHFWKKTFSIKSVHESCQRSYEIGLAGDSIAPAVDPCFFEHHSVDVALASEVKLHRPASSGIFAGKEEHNVTLISSDFFIG